MTYRVEFRGFNCPDSSTIVAVTWQENDPDGPPVGAMRYEEVLGTLRVVFKSGSQYEYDAVPEEVYKALHVAPSVGGTFDQLVKKGGYAYQKVEEAR